MAFNPFHGFRKHSKVIFAILTIICMLTFVLAGNFRGGDALDWVVGLFGGGKKGEYVATLYGDKIYDVELSHQGYERRLANDFMALAMQAGALETAGELRREVLKPAQRDASQLDFKYREEVKLAYLESALQAPDSEQTAVLKQLYPNDPQGPLAAAQRDLQRLGSARSSARLSRLLQSRDFSDFRNIERQMFRDQLVELEQLRQELLRKKMEREAQLIGGIMMRHIAQRVLRVPFFDNGDRRQDLLDERVWWHHADKLGVKFTDGDIRAEVNRFSPVRDVLTDGGMVEPLRKALGQRYKNVDLALVYKALGNELRAGIAQGIVLGDEPGLHGELREAFRRPAAVTPAEYVHFYEQQRTTLTVDLIGVPVEHFLSAKLPEPTEKQLQDFFERFKNKEPQPGNSTPGFKEPHRIGLEWVARRGPTEATLRKVARLLPVAGDLASLKDPLREHYLDLATVLLKPELKAKHPILFLGATGLPLPAPTVAVPSLLGPLALEGAWSAAGPDATVNAYLDQAYETLRVSFRVPSLLQGDPTLAYYTALNLPTVITSTVGLATPGGSLPAPLNAIVTSQMAATERGKKYQAAALKKDLTRRAQVAAGLSLASVGPALTRPATWATVTVDFEALPAPFDPKEPLPRSVIPPYVNREALRFQVFDEAAGKLADSLQNQDIDNLKKAIEAASKDPETARKAVDTALKRFPWLANSIGRTKQSVDRFTLATSPRYRELLQGRFGSSQTLAERLRQADRYFGTEFLPEKTFSPKETSELLVWKTEDIPARTPGSLTEVRAEVVRAWRMQEARKLARKRAEEIRDQITGKEPAKALEILRGILAKHDSWGYLIRLDKVARQVPDELPLPRMEMPGQKGPTRYSPFQVPEEDIAYPPANFVNQLVELSAHKATVIADRPLKHFYVAYAEARSAPASAADVLAQTFPKDVAQNIRQNELWRLMQRDKENEFRDEVMKELRRQAGTLNAQSRFALNPNLKPDESRGGGGPQE